MCVVANRRPVYLHRQWNPSWRRKKLSRACGARRRISRNCGVFPSPAEWKEFSRSLGVIRAGLEAGDPKFGMSLQEAKEVYERVEDCVNLVMKHQGRVKNLEDREKKKTADLASSQQEIMNLKKQHSLATQRLTEAEESIRESRQKAVPPEEVEQLFMRLADFESLAQNAFDAEALSEASVASILGGLTGSKPRSALGSIGRQGERGGGDQQASPISGGGGRGGKVRKTNIGPSPARSRGLQRGAGESKWRDRFYQEGAGRCAASDVQGDTRPADGAKCLPDSAPGVVEGAAEVACTGRRAPTNQG